VLDKGMTHLTISRKAQLSIILIIAAILIMGGITTFYLFRAKSPLSIFSPAQLEEQTDQDRIYFFIDSCLQYTATDALSQYGLKQGVSEPLIRQYIIDNLPSCTGNFRRFESEGFQVTRGNILPTVKMKMP
jgi:hypothetical protein